MHEQLRVGMTLPISVPRNNFKLDESAEHSVLVAGGIGVTPIFCMLQRLVTLGRPVDFIYCARSRLEAAFLAGVKAFAGEQILIHWHFDEEHGKAPDLKTLACWPFTEYAPVLLWPHTHAQCI